MSTTTYNDHNRFTTKMRASVKACLLRHGMTLQEYNGHGPRAAGNGLKPKVLTFSECERCGKPGHGALKPVRGWRVCDDCEKQWSVM